MKTKTTDYVLIFIVLILLAIGITMVFSASYYYALSKWQDKFYFLRKEVIWVSLGLAGMVVTSFIPYRFYKLVSWPLMILSVALLIVTLQVGEVYNGAQRWLTIAGQQFMPSEVSKIAGIIFFAQMLSSKRYAIKSFMDLFKPYLPVLAVLAYLILKQPDYSTTGVIVVVMLSMIFVSGANILYFVPLVSLFLFGSWYYISDSMYRLQRVLTFLDPFQDPIGAGWQIVNSLYALGTGGLLGVGLGQSAQNKLYIPEPQNDFILATFGEEFGFIGFLLLSGLFWGLLYRGIRIASRAPDAFGALLAYGITFLVAVQTIINFGVATSSLPVTGMPLPFISFGGTSLVILLGAMGILVNISKFQQEKEEI
ncbi:MAG: hypothetical protein AVO33_02670 [delta proteobacterium ML8_F1]|nr:MAG: hypothetical protein AVO33_02670 [delta proteobacterium ML8_F1]